MKLNFRDIKKKQFSVDAEGSSTVADVKKQVADHESAEPSQVRLIHSGKVLADDKSVESYNIKETDHIICMITKPKPPPVSQQAPSTPATTSTAQTPAAPAPASSSTTQNAPGTPTPATSITAAERKFDDTSPLMGPERQAAIANMESMGFDRSSIERAMRAAFFNPDRAVDFLLNGIPDNIQRELDAAQNRQQGQQQGQGQSQVQGQQQPAAGNTGAAPAAPAAPAQPGGGDEPVNLFEQAAAANQGGRGSGGSGGSTGPGLAARGLGAGAGGAGAGTGQAADLQFLRDNPMFQQLRQLVQAQPAMLETVLHQVSAANPQLAQLISQNPQQFLEMLTEGGDGEGGEGVPLPPGARDISVTEDERDAIERLCNLGFERDLVIQAYFACDKNEELAANFLFDNQREEDDGTGGAA